ncbi:hypothetical protein DICVIV_12054 [Dictyocaulus viviparus]|uniref:ZP domain-containing protein n=1 Tax=Dictyocaulus viviparus TaxID=29172 RepID=A0A0D8XBH8_DICVI|nr:hypothetical protein DICVIV_12054 [Dictyocaulus viviparus]
MIIHWLLLTCTFQLTHTIPVPNGQLEKPFCITIIYERYFDEVTPETRKAEVECGESTIEVIFLTEAIFEGRIFVIGHSNDSRCASRNIGRRTTSIIINKDECGVVTTRSVNPPGLFSNVKIMISFHNDFITKVDRIFKSGFVIMTSSLMVHMHSHFEKPLQILKKEYGVKFSLDHFNSSYDNEGFRFRFH